MHGQELEFNHQSDGLTTFTSHQFKSHSKISSEIPSIPARLQHCVNSGAFSNNVGYIIANQGGRRGDKSLYNKIFSKRGCFEKPNGVPQAMVKKKLHIISLR